MNYDGEDEEPERDEPEASEPDNSLSVLQAVGLLALLIILQVWIQFVIQKAGSQTTRDTTWIQLLLRNGISGLLVAQAGAWLTGQDLWDLLDVRRFRPVTLLPIIFCSLGASVLSSELMNVLLWIRPIPKELLQFAEKLSQENTFGVLWPSAWLPRSPRS